MARSLAGLYYLAYGVFYAGLFFHRCRQPVLATYDAKHLGVLAALAVPFFFPPLVGAYLRQAGGRALRAWLVAGLVAYAVISTGFYAVQEHRFDPFLQMPPPRFEGKYARHKGDTFRVLALGGSTTWNRRLAPDRKYPHRLEEMLQERSPSRRVEVLNGGMDWYTARHSLIQYVAYAREWEPDVVVILQGANDLCRSFAPARYALGEYDEQYTHYYGPSIRGARPPVLGSQVAGYLADSWFSTLRIHRVDLPLEDYPSLPAFAKYLRELVRQVRRAGALPVVVSQPFFCKENMTRQEQDLLSFSLQLCCATRFCCRQEVPSAGSLARALAAFNDAARRVAGAEQAVFVDAAKELPRTTDYFSDDVHFTERGADALAAAVCAAVAPFVSARPGDTRPLP